MCNLYTSQVTAYPQQHNKLRKPFPQNSEIEKKAANSILNLPTYPFNHTCGKCEKYTIKLNTLLNALAVKSLIWEKYPCFGKHVYFTLFYKFREAICNVVDEVQIYKKVIGNKPECVDTFFVTCTKHAQYKKLRIFIVVGVCLVSFFVSCKLAEETKLITGDVYQNSYEIAVRRWICELIQTCTFLTCL